MEEMREARLGDPRRRARAARILESWAQRPESSIPEASESRSQSNLTYRFLDQATTCPGELLESHVGATRARLAGTGEVWVAQDTTALDYTAQKATRGLGPLGKGHSRGLFVHSALAMSVEGTPLGLLHQQTWARSPEESGKAGARRSKATAEKESAKWLGPITACGEIGPEVRVLLIGDREADVYDLFAYPRAAHVDLLVRAAQNRRIEGEEALLWDAVAAGPAAGHLEVEVGRAGERAPRVARLEVRFRMVEVSVPRHAKQRTKKQPVPLWAVHVREVTAPEGESALEWKLLSTRPVHTWEEAARLVRAYAARWRVERFHYTLKSGCQVEALQLETQERLERALVLYSIVAWRLLYLTYLAREIPQAPCTEALSESEWKMLHLRAYPSRALPATAPTLQEAVLWIGRLGGFMGSNAKSPGVKTLWRGLRRLSDLLEGARLLRPDF
ncbi:MAG: IS4 family transposase [Gemmatimonadetes bacterium]|nr:IS4 family transposase [Gemmatimonadota bacterium]